jgi:hypothetical protein
MASQSPLTPRVERSFAEVAATSGRFRADVNRLLEPGGIMADNVATLAGWLHHRIWDLLDASETVLRGWGTGETR